MKKLIVTVLYTCVLIAAYRDACAASLRKFPYPYVNMVAIMSDTDLSDKDEFENIHRFLNTEEDCASLGKGVGLDVGDTFWMDMYHEQDKDNWRINSKSWSWIYWHDGENRYGDLMGKYIHAGWIDIPHTFFSYYIGADSELYHASVGSVLSDWNSSERKIFKAQAEKVLGEWKRIGYKPVAWADHANNPWNVITHAELHLQRAATAGENVLVLNSGIDVKPNDLFTFPDNGEVVQVSKVIDDGDDLLVVLKKGITRSYGKGKRLALHNAANPQLGAVTGSPYYCADLAIRAGIKFFWTRPPKDLAKQRKSGARGYETSLEPLRLSDGTEVWGFYRYYEQPEANNNHLGKCIDRIVSGDEKGGPLEPWTYSIITTHLGYVAMSGNRLDDDVYKANGKRWLNPETVDAVRKLKALQNNGRFLVARTSRLLQYNLAHDMLSKYAGTPLGYTTETLGGDERITIHKINDDVFGAFVPELDDIRGLTFYCNNPSKAKIFIGSTMIKPSELEINPPDQTGRPSIGIKWFKRDVTDYTRSATPKGSPAGAAASH